MLSISIAFNAISVHATCTAVFVAVAAVLGFGLGSVRTLGRITWLAWVGVTSILVASRSFDLLFFFFLFQTIENTFGFSNVQKTVLIVTIAVGVEDRPAAAPQDGPWSSDYELFKRPTFHAAASALSSLTFAFAGTPAFFPIVSEMRDPRHYSRSLMICQLLVTAIYLAIGCVVYYYCGSYVASPALGSAGANLKKVAYGCALPGLIVTATLYVHVRSSARRWREKKKKRINTSLTLWQLPGKYLLIRFLRNSKHLALNSPTHWVSWIGSTLGVTLLAYIVASAIPVFSDLVSLVGALLGTLLSLQPMGCMWLYDHWNDGKITRTPRWMMMVCWSVFIIVVGTFLMISGTYGAVVDIIASYQESGGSAAWSCADNSGST